MPHYWDVFHAGDCTVHRGEIESFADTNTVVMRDGERFQTDAIIMATGFTKSSGPFGDELQPLCGLGANPAGSDEETRWVALETEAEATVDELLPVLSRPPSGLDAQALGPRKSSDGPTRHYRRIISPYLAAQGDRSLFFLCMLHTVSTPLVVEMQSLWGVAFMLGLLDVPELADMEKEAAVWNAWTRKRYPGIGRSHSYALFDFQSVRSCSLAPTFPPVPDHALLDGANPVAGCSIVQSSTPATADSVSCAHSILTSCWATLGFAPTARAICWPTCLFRAGRVTTLGWRMSSAPSCR